MENAKHSQEPWDSRTTTRLTDKGIETDTFIVSGSQIIATLSDASVETKKANARLISAAPMLADALQEMASQHHCGCGNPACNECKRDRMCAKALRESGYCDT